ncbi:MAG TPA: hypothetical protein VE135_11300 [Pyrinomonadaceae bacterium]|nr:hypothetical protein [Pyrinomonadaceae bacterium]
MRNILLVSLLLMLVSPSYAPLASQEGSAVVVLGFKWSRSRQIPDRTATPDTAPAPAMIPQNKNYQRNVRVNDPAGSRDPNLDTMDGRSAAMEKAVQESRTPQTKAVDGFAYKARVQNASSRVIEILFWEYQFTDASNPTAVTRRQFLCGVNIKPGKEKELQAFSLSGPSEVVNVESLANKSANAFQENVLINRVEYSDGSIWQRKDWNFGEIRLTYARAVNTPWGNEMCRGL